MRAESILVPLVPARKRGRYFSIGKPTMLPHSVQEPS